MKRIAFLLAACVLLCGCQNSASELVPETTTVPDTTAAITEITAEQTTETTAPALLALADDWSNRNQLMRTHGISMNLKNSAGEYITEQNCVAENGTLSVQICCTPDTEPEVRPDDVQVVYFAAVNGQLCDFTCGGVQSEYGAVTLTRPVNQESVDPLVLSDIPMQEGGNMLAVYTLVYFPQMGLHSAGAYAVPFASDQAYSGERADAADMSALEGVQIETAEGKTPAEIRAMMTELTTVTDEDVPTDTAIGCLYISQETPLQFPLCNTQTDNPQDKRGFCVIMQDGKIIPAWNGKSLLTVSVKSNDLLLKLPFSAARPAGKYTLFGCVYFELGSEYPESREYTALCYVGEKP